MKELEREPEQRKTLFRKKCKIEGKCCDLVIDGSDSKNLVSIEVVHKLKLKCTLPLEAYRMSWLQNGHWVSINKQVLVLLILGIIMITSYLMIFPWMHATFCWGDHGNLTRG